MTGVYKFFLVDFFFIFGEVHEDFISNTPLVHNL